MSLLASVLLGSTESSVELLSKEILDVIAAILRTVTSSLDIECVLLSLFFHHLINTICCIESVWKIVRRELVWWWNEIVKLLIGHFVVARWTGSELCRTAPWDYYWDTVASFNFLFLGCAGNWPKSTAPIHPKTVPLFTELNTTPAQFPGRPQYSGSPI